MLKNDRGEDTLRFRYHHPVPNFYKVENPKNPLKTISDKALKEFEDLIIKEGFSGFCYSYLDEKDYSKFQKDSKYVILLKFPISPTILEMDPSPKKCKDMDDEFQWVAPSLFKLNDFLRAQGFACELINPVDDDLSLRNLAIKSNEAVITRSNMCLFEDGLTMSIFALACSIENLPLKKDNELLWVREYCSTCGKCIDSCSHNAFDENEKIIPRNCPAHRDGCSDCILICPLFKKDINEFKNKYELKMKKLAERGLL